MFVLLSALQCVHMSLCVSVFVYMSIYVSASVTSTLCAALDLIESPGL